MTRLHTIIFCTPIYLKEPRTQKKYNNTISTNSKRVVDRVGDFNVHTSEGNYCFNDTHTDRVLLEVLTRIAVLLF